MNHLKRNSMKDLKDNPIPNYYVGKYYGYEARKICEDFELPYHIATAVTYLVRCERKHGDSRECIQKAINHLQFQLEYLETKQKIHG
tara:strand:+ start:1710 stop:1970 length:261 start_codon:yes stop_codon:yes gene_type:complete